MNNILDFLVRHGAAVLFTAVFIDQVGIPVPAIPWLLGAGALIVAGKINGFTALGAAAIGSLLADTIWFYLGKYRGRRVLDLLCRVSLEPDSCVRRTQDIYARFGMRGVVAAKFIPGLSTLAPPLAGSGGASIGRFLFFDGLGSLLYVASFFALGGLFSRQLQEVLDALSSLGIRALALVVGLMAVYIGYKYYQRRRLLKELRMARIPVDELRGLLAAGGSPIILDLRSKSELATDPESIPGAMHVLIDEIDQWRHQLPTDREIIIYCSCPNEESSARVALSLQRRGFTHVRPLLGGLDAWRQVKNTTASGTSASTNSG